MKRNFLKNKKSVWQKKLEHGRIIKSSKEDKQKKSKEFEKNFKKVFDRKS